MWNCTYIVDTSPNFLFHLQEKMLTPMSIQLFIVACNGGVLCGFFLHSSSVVFSTPLFPSTPVYSHRDFQIRFFFIFVVFFSLIDTIGALGMLPGGGLHLYWCSHPTSTAPSCLHFGMLLVMASIRKMNYCYHRYLVYVYDLY